MTDDVPAKPRTLEWAFQTTVAWAVFTVLAAASLWTQQSKFRQLLIDNNNKIKDVSKRRDYSGAGSTLNHDLHQGLLYSTIQAVLVGAIIVGVALMLRRGRPWARWVLVGFASILSLIVPTGVGVVTQLVSPVVSPFPMVYRVLTILAGLCALGVLVLAFLPETRVYFRGQRAAMRPATAAGSAGGPPSGGMLGALFGRRAAPRDDAATDTATRGLTSRDLPSRDVSSEPVAPPEPRPAKPRTATRPGSVKPKGSGAARSKSRQR